MARFLHAMRIMNNESDDRANGARERDEVASLQSGNLALLYDAILTNIVRLQASRQQIPDVESFRKRIKATLQEIEHVTVPAGYDIQDIRDTHFAVVALLDSVILHSNSPVRAQWETRLLQQELFGHAEAGVVFFEKLASFQTRRDSEQHESLARYKTPGCRLFREVVHVKGRAD